MRLGHVVSSSRKFMQEQGLGSTLRFGRRRVGELRQASSALRAGPEQTAAVLQKLVNDRLEFDAVFIGPDDIRGCDPSVLKHFLLRRLPKVVDGVLPRAGDLDPLALSLVCDVLYRTWRFRDIVALAPVIRAKRRSRFFPRTDNMLRRAAFQSGAMTLAEDGLDLLSDASLADLLLRGDVWNATGRLELASNAYERAIVMQADNPMVRLHYGFHLLKRGDIRDGLASWGMAERMFGYYPLKRPEALWRNEDLEGRSLLIVFEHGFGDMIQFARYLGRLVERYPAARCIGLVPAPIVSLLSACYPRVAFAPVAPDGCDFYIPVTQLPNVIGGDVYEPQDYLALPRSPAPAVNTAGLRVGICWRGHPRQYEQSRSVAIEQFQGLFDIPGVTFEVLLNAVTPAEAVVLGQHPNVSVPAIKNFLDLFHTMQACDLVVSVDTSIVHLAGAAGQRVLLLSRPDACWRWGAAGSASRWYKHVEVLRHPFDLDWDHVLGQARMRILAAQAEALPPAPAAARATA